MKSEEPHILRKDSRGKKTLATLALFLISLTVCFLIAEFVFAEFYDTDEYRISDKLFDPVVGWRTRPGTYWLKPPHSFTKHEVYINRQGLRNKEIPERKVGVRRLAILGDSFVAGRAVPTEELFSTLMETHLNAGMENSYEVINAGVPGYGTAQELLFMKELANEGIVADMYLVIIFANDILDNLRLTYSELHENPVQPGFVLDEKQNLELRHTPKYRLFKSSNFISPKEGQSAFKLVGILKVKIEGYLQTKPGMVELARSVGLSVEIPRVPGTINAWYREDLLDMGVPLMKGLIKEMKDQAQRYNAYLAVAVIPSSMMVYADTYGPLLESTFPDSTVTKEFNKDPLRPQRIAASLCRELNIAFIDLYPVLMEHREEELFVPEEGHFSKSGHAVAGRALAEFVASQERLRLVNHEGQ